MTDAPKDDAPAARRIDKGTLQVFLDDGNCSALLVDKKDHSFHSGITYRNIEQLISNALADGYEDVMLCEYKFKRMYRDVHIAELPQPKLSR